MPRKPQDITDAELAVIRQLWDAGSQTIRQLTACLYPDDEAQYSTVKKLLERLEDKECVFRDRSSMVHLFSAAIQRDDIVDRRLREVADSLCDGSITPLLTHAARNDGLTRKQRDTLRSLIDELQKKEERRRK